MGKMKKALAEKFDEEIRFFRGWIDKPKAVGSIVPTSGVTARKMASIVRPERDDMVLELGPGTGVITRAILEKGIKPENLVSVEYSADFVERLKRDMPGVNFVHGDAFELEAVLAPWKDMRIGSVISDNELLYFIVLERVCLLDIMLDLLPALRLVVQITYGAQSSISARRGSYSLVRFDFIVRHIPPPPLCLYT